MQSDVWIWHRSRSGACVNHQQQHHCYGFFLVLNSVKSRCRCYSCVMSPFETDTPNTIASAVIMKVQATHIAISKSRSFNTNSSSIRPTVLVEFSLAYAAVNKNNRNYMYTKNRERTFCCVYSFFYSVQMQRQFEVNVFTEQQM